MANIMIMADSDHKLPILSVLKPAGHTVVSASSIALGASQIEDGFAADVVIVDASAIGAHLAPESLYSLREMGWLPSDVSVVTIGIGNLQPAEGLTTTDIAAAWDSSQLTGLMRTITDALA